MPPRLPRLRLRTAAVFFFTVACDFPTQLTAPTPGADEAPVVQPVIAHANVKALDTTDLDIGGRLVFTPTPEGVAISGLLTGLDKSRLHAFHIHEAGDCSAPDGSSAGGHFAPEGGQHAAPSDPDSHLGDLGNLTTSPEGNVEVDTLVRDARLSGELGLVGRAVVLHRGDDDMASQPAGDAGSRIACGVIKHGAG